MINIKATTKTIQKITDEVVNRVDLKMEVEGYKPEVEMELYVIMKKFEKEIPDVLMKVIFRLANDDQEEGKE